LVIPEVFICADYLQVMPDACLNTRMTDVPFIKGTNAVRYLVAGHWDLEGLPLCRNLRKQNGTLQALL